MAIAEIKLDCESEELILERIKSAWVNFVTATSEISLQTSYYSQQREKMVRAIRSAIPQDCYNKIVILPDVNDPFHRSKMDQAVDDALLEMQYHFPDHNEVNTLIKSKPYWDDFVNSRK